MSAASADHPPANGLSIISSAAVSMRAPDLGRAPHRRRAERRRRGAGCGRGTSPRGQARARSLRSGGGTSARRRHGDEARGQAQAAKRVRAGMTRDRTPHGSRSRPRAGGQLMARGVRARAACGRRAGEFLSLQRADDCHASGMPREWVRLGRHDARPGPECSSRLTTGPRQSA